MIICDDCSKTNVYKVRSIGNGKFVCRECLPKYVRVKQSDGSFAFFHEKVFLPEYGNELKSRIDELERRVILPYESKIGGYYVGRRRDDGGVDERVPSY